MKKGLPFPAATGIALVLTQMLAAQSIATKWPTLAGRFGPYGGIKTADDVKAMIADGFTMAVISAPSTNIQTALQAGGAVYLDSHMWGFIDRVCKGQGGKTCSLSGTDQRSILDQVSAYLNQVQSQPALAGYWILDDYPHGDVSSTLIAIRQLIQKSNAGSGVKRPTICGVGGNLDRRPAPGRPFTPDRSYLDAAMVNVVPSACDVVAPYVYGVVRPPAGLRMDIRSSADMVDWTMKDLLPYMMAELRVQGFESNSGVLLPIVHAFSYQEPGKTAFWAKPGKVDVARQMRAYCQASAIGVLFFTWQGSQSDMNYSNDQDIRDGVKLGMADCRQIWR
jgi:hypothetical protein